MNGKLKILNNGSKVAIIAPARKVTRDEMFFAVHWLKEKGFVPVFDERLFAEHHIFAGDDNFRASVFQEYLDTGELYFTVTYDQGKEVKYDGEANEWNAE